METLLPRSLPHALRLSDTLETCLRSHLKEEARKAFLYNTSLPNEHGLNFRIKGEIDHVD